MRVLGFAGSLRNGSWNKVLLHQAGKIVSSLRSEFAEYDLKDVPLYNADLEAQGFPDAVISFRQQVVQADAIIVSTPEYNHGIPGVLKNAIDWLSRPPNSLNGKVAAIMGASTGNFGTVNAQHQLAQLLRQLNVITIPSPKVYLMRAETAFDNTGRLLDERIEERLKSLVERCLETARRFASEA